MPERLAMVSMLVRDYDEARDWYQKALGFTCAEDTPLGNGKRWVVMRPDGGDSGAALLLAQASKPAQTAAIGNQAGGRVWLFLETDDFQSRHAAMKEAGVKFLESPRQEAYGIVAQFEDLYGNRWDLLERR